MALQTKLSRSPIHQLFTAQSLAAANTVSTDSIAMQRSADETATCFVRLSGDPGAGGANVSFIVVEGLAENGSGDWCELARINITNGAQPAGSVKTGVAFYGSEWGVAFTFPAAPQVRVATRQIGVYVDPGVTADVYIVE